MKRILLVLFCLLSASTLFAEVDLSLGAGISTKKVENISYQFPNNDAVVKQEIGINGTLDIDIKNGFSIYTNFHYALGSWDGYQGINSLIGAAYKVSISDNDYLRFGLGYAVSNISGKTEFGGFGFGINADYNHNLNRFFSLKFGVQNDFLFTTYNSSYSYPNDFRGSYYLEKSMNYVDKYYTFGTRIYLEFTLRLWTKENKNEVED